MKSTGRKDLRTWYGPAVRAPSIYGNGGNVDYVRQWTYTYPNPIKVGLATDELFALSQGRPNQKVNGSIQIIWKRTELTNWKPGETDGRTKEEYRTEWEKTSPDAKYISIAPDHLSEGTWLEFARPLKAMSNHGWGSLGDKLGFATGSYVTTNVGARKRMKYLIGNVIKPLGPAMLQVPDYKTDVAFLESFASQMFAGRGTYGWGEGWGADSYMVARYAGLQPQIIYDETIQKKGLEQYKVLFLTDCDVLSQSVADAIRIFQQNGGVVVGDENLAPGIQPDILIERILRGTPDVTKKKLVEAAQNLDRELQQVYTQPLKSSNPNVLTRLRQTGESYYVFTVNDHRTYGDYLGQYKKVMEKGLPSKAQVSLNTLPVGSVYDLMNHRQVPTTKILGKVQFPVDLDAGEGNLFLVTPTPIGKLQVSAPSIIKRGNSVTLKVLLLNQQNKTLDAVVPLDVRIVDPKGREAEGSRYYGAQKGRLSINLDIAPNDATGEWKVEATEALTGQKAVATFNVK